jgi:hypothetical protein
MLTSHLNEQSPYEIPRDLYDLYEHHFTTEYSVLSPDCYQAQLEVYHPRP